MGVEIAVLSDSGARDSAQHRSPGAYFLSSRCDDITHTALQRGHLEARLEDFRALFYF